MSHRLSRSSETCTKLPNIIKPPVSCKTSETDTSISVTVSRSAEPTAEKITGKDTPTKKKKKIQISIKFSDLYFINDPQKAELAIQNNPMQIVQDAVTKLITKAGLVTNPSGDSTQASESDYETEKTPTTSASTSASSKYSVDTASDIPEPKISRKGRGATWKKNDMNNNNNNNDANYKNKNII